MPLHPWEWPHNYKPLLRIHADYAGPFQGRMLQFLCINCANSILVKAGPLSVTIISGNPSVAKLLRNFSIVTAEVADEVIWTFECASTSMRVWHVTTAPYHPASNGLAERDVQTVKEGLRKMVDGSLETRVSRFLFRY